MKGAKEGKADGSKQQEAGPALFPRLHVAETKKAGPRGPPRNKMALYEQLTIPSHRFKPSPMPLPSSGRAMMSPSMTSPTCQAQMQAGSYDSMYSYVPMSYVNPSIIPCIPMMNVGLYGVEATSSMYTSSSKSTVVDRVTEIPLVEGAGTRTPKSLSHSKHYASTKKGRGDDDFAVPTYSSATQASSQTRPSSPLQVQQGSKGERDFISGKGVVMEKRSPACTKPVRRIMKEKSMEVMSKERKDDACWPTASGECVTVCVIDNDVISQEANHNELDGVSFESYGGHVKPSGRKIVQEEVRAQKNEAGQKIVGFIKTVQAPPDTVHDVDNLRAATEQDTLSSQSLENESGEVLEPSQQRRGSSAETGSSILENVTAGSIQFRDVVDAFGQHEFWKVQKIIMRQQRLFSRQVFELHRVIEVQQLLAKSFTLSLNIDEVLGEEYDNVPVPASPVAEVPEVSGVPATLEVPVVPEVNVCKASAENSRPVLQALSQPIYPLPITSQQGFNSESLWQAAAPNYASNPWAARMASSPYMYVPYPPPCSPGYGVYPMMGAPMPMYGLPGGMQGLPGGITFPTWQQPGISQTWTAQDSAAAGAATAWYGQQVVPGVGPTARMGIVSPVCNSECPTSSGASQSIENTPHMGSARQAGERSHAGVNCANKVDSLENFGWAKGWGRTEGRWVRGERSIVQNKACVAVLRDKDGEDCRDGEDAGCGAGQLRSNEGDRVLESEEYWPAGARHEGSLQGKSLKHMRTEGLEPDACRWFPILSPAKRVMHQNGVIKVVPRAMSATSESTANILLSIQTERQR